MENSNAALDRYAALIRMIDDHESALRMKYAPHIACREGCDACCILTSVCAIEGYLLWRAIAVLHDGDRRALAANRDRADGTCQLLHQGRCLVYGDRPVICRTHGYPLMIGRRVDFCERNFSRLKTIDSENIIDLERMNEALGRINLLFISLVDDARFRSERLRIRDVAGFAR